MSGKTLLSLFINTASKGQLPKPVHGLYASPVSPTSPAAGFAVKHLRTSTASSSDASATTASSQPSNSKALSVPPTSSHLPSTSTQPPALFGTHELPPALRRELPKVMYRPPWVPAGQKDFVHKHGKAIMAILQKARQEGTKLSAEQVHKELLAGQFLERPPATQRLTPKRTRDLLEQLRYDRMVVGSKNPQVDLQQGHRDYPYLYWALPFQIEHKGRPSMVAAQLEEQKRKSVELAFRRLRNGKPPFRIHRVQARTSSFQHALAYEAVAKAFREDKHAAKAGEGNRARPASEEETVQRLVARAAREAAAQQSS